MSAHIEKNEVLERLPKHLLDLVIDQPYNSYTAQDHAIWRYVMRQNVDYLQKVAHHSYTEGLKATGISIDRIPHMYGMNRILKEIGWAAVAVDGFIPPAAFMEFQAYNVLVIAADIRPFDQIEYTPAPDIIHEAAGHAPIIADPEYAEHLRFFGEIGSKAFSSAKDYELYEAIRHLSILKADPYTSKADIKKAEEALDFKERNLGMPSEMAQIRNLHWWTVEYGLIGDLKNPKIYGAGLLSSIGESVSALQDEVRKIPYTIDAVEFNFDITTRQPQLFVTPDFQQLNDVLNHFADSMALRHGGLEGINKAIDSGSTACCEFSSGLQVSGTFTEVITSGSNPIYLNTSGPTSLSYKNKELEGHGTNYHSEGFGSPIGRLAGSLVPLRYMTDGDLESMNIHLNEMSELKIDSGIVIKGRLSKITRQEGLIVLLSFEECTVTYRNTMLFEPSWGTYDMAVGDKIVSAYNGPADPDAFGLTFPVPKEKTHKIQHSDSALKLHSHYETVRKIRENGNDLEALYSLFGRIKNNYPEDWLLPLEILEVIAQTDPNHASRNEILEHLNELSDRKPELGQLIQNGKRILHKEIT